MKYNLLKEKILKGLEIGVVKIIDDYGIRCQIGEYSFYFIGTEDSELSVSEYWKNYDKEMTSNMITDILKSVKAADENGIDDVERSYYICILNENIL